MLREKSVFFLPDAGWLGFAHHPTGDPAAFAGTAIKPKRSIVMKRTFLALAMTAALTVFASGAQAMAEFDKVQDTLRAFLVELNIPTDAMDNLTLKQMREIIAIADSREMGDGARTQVLGIIDR